MDAGLVSILHLLPLVAVLVDHEEAVVVEVAIVRVMAMIRGEADALETGNLRSAHTTTAASFGGLLFFLYK
jgi:hypothetical protein